jgi:hypothetical protein
LCVDRQSAPSVGVVFPLLEQQNAAAGARLAFGDEDHAGRFFERRVFGAVLKAREVAIVLIRPSGDFTHRHRDGFQAIDDGGRDVKHGIV